MKRKLTTAGIILGLCAACVVAGEITAVFTLQVKKGSLDITRYVQESLTLTNANPNVSGLTQLIPTTAAGTAITMGSVVTNGVAWFRNLDTNNWIEVGVQDSSTNFLPLLRLDAGEAWPVRLAIGVTPYARANTASIVLECPIFDR